MASPDAYAVLSTALAPLQAAVNAKVADNYRRAAVEDERAYRRATMEEERAFQRNMLVENRMYAEAAEQRRRKDRKADEEEERRRILEGELAKVTPPDFKVDPSWDEADLAREVYKRKREQDKLHKEEDANVALQRKIQEAKALTEAQLRQAAELAGVPEASTEKDLGKLARETARLNMEAEDKLKAQQATSRIASAKTLPEYGDYRAGLAKLEAERMKLLAESAMPEPKLNPGMTREEERAIYAEVGNLPEVVALFAGEVDREKRMAALKSGNLIGAIGGMKPEIAERIGMAISDNHKRLAENLQRTKNFEHSQAVDKYIGKIRALPSLLNESDRRIESFYRGLGKIPGMEEALRAEPQEALVTDGLKLMMPKEVPTPAPAASGTDSPAALTPGGLPLPPLRGQMPGPAVGAGVQNPLIGPAFNPAGTPAGVSPDLLAVTQEYKNLGQAMRGSPMIPAVDYRFPFTFQDGKANALFSGLDPLIATQLGVQPSPIGSSSVMRSPANVVGADRQAYHNRLLGSDLPPEVIEDMHWEGLYRNPFYQNPDLLRRGQ